MKSEHRDTDLTDVVLFLANFAGVDDVLRLSENARYNFIPPCKNTNASWLGVSTTKPHLPILCIRLGQNMYSEEGWVCGSAADTDIADIQLAINNQTGVSRRHFRIDIHPLSYCPRVTVLARSLQISIDGNRILLPQGEDIQITDSARLDLGGTSFEVWRPRRSRAEERIYNQQALQFCKDAISAIPKFFPSLKTAPETATGNVRYGRNNTVYVMDGSSQKGASSSVTLVRERASGEIFAAKEPYYKSSDNAGVRRDRWEQLLQEYENLLRLDHPHIVKVYDIVSAHNDMEPPWLIEEYLPNCLRPKDLDEPTTVRVAIQIFSALAYLHAVDTIHCDVKPANILFENGQIKLADFGAARRTQGKLDSFVGTPIYMAPELFLEPRSCDNKIDMFSCGLILLECLSNWIPQSFQAVCHRSHAQWIRQAILPHIAEVPANLRPLLHGLLRRPPRKRWSALKCLAWLGGQAHARDPNQPYREKTGCSPEEVTVVASRHIDTEYSSACTPEDRSRRKKRPASSELLRREDGSGVLRKVKFEQPRALMFGELQNQSSGLPWPPSQSPILDNNTDEHPVNKVSSSQRRSQPVTSNISSSDVAWAMTPKIEIIGQVPQISQSDLAATTGQSLSALSPNITSRASVTLALQRSPFCAPTPDRDEGEFPTISEEARYSAETDDSELKNDWEMSGSERGSEDGESFAK